MKQPVGFKNTCSLHKDNFLSQTRSYTIFNSAAVINIHTPDTQTHTHTHTLFPNLASTFPTHRQCLNKIEMCIGLILKREGGNSLHTIHPMRTGSMLQWVNPDAGDKAIARLGGGETRGLPPTHFVAQSLLAQ